MTGDEPVSSLTTWDPDGAGPLPQILVAAGGFQGAGDVAADGIAIWDGSAWDTLGDAPGITGSIWDIEVYNAPVVP